MALKLFAKTVEVEVEIEERVRQDTLRDQKIDKTEQNLNDLGMEVVKLRQEVNTLLARQQSFRIALKRLREYLEERGVQENTEEKRSYDELSREERAKSAGQETPIKALRAPKDKENLH